MRNPESHNFSPAAPHPAAWRRRDFVSQAVVTFDFSSRHVSALMAAARSSRSIPLADLGREQFDISPIAAEVSQLRAEVLRGTGLVIL
ncbi:MAG TPA: hypothetical protein VGF69_24010 [Thermoanaerobaculia bacterium]|jgi:hypothetical protein